MSVLEKIDVVNTAAIIAIAIWLYLTIMGTQLAFRQEDAWVAFKDHAAWVMIMVLAIFSNYGISRARNGGQNP